MKGFYIYLAASALLLLQVSVCEAANNEGQLFRKRVSCFDVDTAAQHTHIRTTIECLSLCVADQCISAVYDVNSKLCYLSQIFSSQCVTTTITYRAVGKCPTNYIYNQHSDTCFRLAATQQTYQAAFDICQNSGEHLITFGTAAASQLTRTEAARLSADDAGWGGCLWLGARLENFVFKWKGLVTGNMPANGEAESDWFSSKPDLEGEGCVYMRGTGWDDVSCTYLCNVVCESNL